MINLKHISTLFCAVCLPLAGLVTVAQAAQTGDAVVYNFQGKFILSSPCTINNDQVIDITFGNVAVNKVDGINYLNTIPYTVDCQGATDDSPLTLTLSGTPESFDSAAITTSADGLGIQIQANGQPFPLNTSRITTLGELASLTLKAVPVKDPAKELTQQAFTATATLKAEYQ